MSIRTVNLAIAGLASDLAPSETQAAALPLAAFYLLGPRLLPREKGGRFGWLLFGAAAYGGILLLT